MSYQTTTLHMQIFRILLGGCVEIIYVSNYKLLLLFIYYLLMSHIGIETYIWSTNVQKVECKLTS